MAVRFGQFVFDPRSGELRHRSGSVAKLRRQLSCILALLTSRAGEVVTREELRRALWGDRVVDFDSGLNFCMKRLRAALKDDADAPRYIETLPKRGYRFIASVTPYVEGTPGESCVSAADSAAPSGHPPGYRRWMMLVAGALSLLTLTAILGRADFHTRPPIPKHIRLIVLPFENLGGDWKQDYVGDGLTDDMITQLGQLAPERLSVVARITSMQYKASTKGAAHIGRRLDAEYVLTGSVRMAERVRVNVQLIRVDDEAQLWAESYERPLGDIYNIQREVAQRTARSLALELLPTQQAALARASTISTEAYNEYLKGSEFLRRGTEADFKSAVTAFNRALQYDAEFAMAHAALAGTHFLLHDYGFVSREETCRHAQRPVERAIALDGMLPGSHVWRAEFDTTCRRDIVGAEREFRRALELNRSDASAYRRYGWFLLTAGRAPQALEQMQSALALDPLSTDAHAAIGYVLHRLGREWAALMRAQEALRLDPQFPFAMYVASGAYSGLKRYPEAIEALEHAVRASGQGPKYLFSLGTLYATNGRMEDARNVLDQLTAMARHRYVPPDYLRSLANRLNVPAKSVTSESDNVALLRHSPRPNSPASVDGSAD